MTIDQCNTGQEPSSGRPNITSEKDTLDMLNRALGNAIKLENAIEMYNVVAPDKHYISRFYTVGALIGTLKNRIEVTEEEHNFCHDFAWAVKRLKMGYHVRRSAWAKSASIYFPPGSGEHSYMEISMNGEEACVYSLSRADVNTTDWGHYAG